MWPRGDFLELPASGRAQGVRIPGADRFSGWVRQAIDARAGKDEDGIARRRYFSFPWQEPPAIEGALLRWHGPAHDHETPGEGPLHERGGF